MVHYQLLLLLLLLLLISNLFKRHTSPTQQYAGLQEGCVQRKITRNIHQHDSKKTAVCNTTLIN